jgi:hypothetical protein
MDFRVELRNLNKQYIARVWYWSGREIREKECPDTAF